MRLAYQGEPGAFSHEACLRFAPEAEPVGFDSFDEAVETVRNGGCGAAMLPVENSLAGPVHPVLRLLADAGLRETGRFALPIRIMLIGSPGAVIDGVRVVASHPVALLQCRQLIAELGLETETAFDTAGAARLLAEAPEPKRAVLASRVAAERHALPVLRADVQDRASNHTTFVLMRP
ncbi:MAG: prephenate dehydratase [Proteobacteria bacterium]|nr:prephenate dehydratase [Pseudomonadota bacterium]MBW3618229.1 prephenate dehydratase [Pseudomonadota bacterium]